MITRITDVLINLPDNNEINQENNAALTELIGQAANARRVANGLELYAKDLLPRILLYKKRVSLPSISFEVSGNSHHKSWQAGNLVFGFNLSPAPKQTAKLIKPSIRTLQDEAGSYTEIKINGRKLYLLTLPQLLTRLNEQILEVNHLGFNIGPALVGSADYAQFKRQVADWSNLYNYPAGDEWPFIIPSNDQEFTSDIRIDTISRNPKFEIVYSADHDMPLLQFDLNSSLSKMDVMKLLPEPYGVSFDGLDNYFRSVFIYTGWQGIVVRFDIRFRENGKDFGYWIIKDGGRIR